MATCSELSSPDTFQYGDLTVRVLHGDITKENTDCIINSCNHTMDFSSGGVSKALVAKAGPNWEKTCQLQKEQLIKSGVALSKPGRLKCRYVLHIVGQDSELGWYKILKQSINEVDKAKLTSLSIPALGTGDLKISAGMMANIIAETIIQFGNFNTSSLKHIRLVIFEESMLSTFISAFSGNEESCGNRGYVYTKPKPTLCFPNPYFMEQQQQLIKGEKEAMAGNETVCFQLTAEKFFKNTPEEFHYRTAESHFYRKIGVFAKDYGIDMVEYIVNPKLITRFRKAQMNLKKLRGEDLSHPVLAFHGTTTSNVKMICEDGFLVPGDKKYRQLNDRGFFGAGVYFSGCAGYSIPYALVSDPPLLILCQVLTGKVYTFKRRGEGQSLKPGFDSHTSPAGKELVIFDSSHILPVYVIHCKIRNGPTTDTERE